MRNSLCAFASAIRFEAYYPFFLPLTVKKKGKKGQERQSRAVQCKKARTTRASVLMSREKGTQVATGACPALCQSNVMCGRSTQCSTEVDISCIAASPEAGLKRRRSLTDASSAAHDSGGREGDSAYQRGLRLLGDGRASGILTPTFLSTRAYALPGYAPSDLRLPSVRRVFLAW